MQTAAIALIVVLLVGMACGLEITWALGLSCIAAVLLDPKLTFVVIAQMQKAVTDLLTPLEYSIAMLACRDWTNQEIGEHLGLSVNTVKHYVSGILEKLHIDKREKIKEFVNQ